MKCLYKLLAVVPGVLAAVAQVQTDVRDLAMSNTGVGVQNESGALRESHPFQGFGRRPGDLDLAETLPPWVLEEIKNLPPAPGGVGIESVVGVDSRVRLYTTNYPARATALITFSGGYCTGWFYGPNIVATAGHCVHTGGSAGRWQTNVRVYPGYNAGSAPYGSYPAKWVASVLGWTRDGNEAYDYGVVKLSTNVGNTVGWFGLWWQSASLTGLPSVIAGYPGDKSPTQSQWLAADLIRVTGDRQIFYQDDTFGGQSGSAIWQDRPPGSSYCANGPCVMGIHAYGLHGSGSHATHNHGTRITQAVYNNLVNWKNTP